MKIPYRKYDEYIPVEISKMRPKESYENLIKKRTWAIDDLIAKHGEIPADYLHDRKCPNCDSTENAPIMNKDHLVIVKCTKCEMVFVNPIFDEEHYLKTYQAADYQQIVKELGEDSHDYRRERFGKERVEIVERYVKKKPISYLDVGCSTGFVVEAGKDAGWDAVGIELNPSAVRFGKKRGLEIIEGDLSHKDLKSRKFDVISLFDVLEHIVDPKKIIQDCMNMLNDDGIIFLYLPNWDSAIVGLLGEKAHIIWPTEHLNYWSPETISKFFEVMNMKVEFLVTEGLDIIDYTWYQEHIEGQNVDHLKKIQDKMQFYINAGCYGVNLRVIARKQS